MGIIVDGKTYISRNQYFDHLATENKKLEADLKYETIRRKTAEATLEVAARQLEAKRKENKQLQHDLDTVTKAACENLFLEKAEKAAVIKKLRESLEFYADKSNWAYSELITTQGNNEEAVFYTEIKDDDRFELGGRLARKVLADLDEK